MFESCFLVGGGQGVEGTLSECAWTNGMDFLALPWRKRRVAKHVKIRRRTPATAKGSPGQMGNWTNCGGFTGRSRRQTRRSRRSLGRGSGGGQVRGPGQERARVPPGLGGAVGPQRGPVVWGRPAGGWCGARALGVFVDTPKHKEVC